MPSVLDALTRRGMVHDATPGLAERLAHGPITGYVGFDPTADSLGVGNLVPVMALAWLQRTGGRPIAVLGGGTGLVGDPSGKRGERPMLTREAVEHNAAVLRSQLGRFLDFDAGSSGAMVLNNIAWLGELRLLDFLRDTGKHFTVNYMLQKESVAARMATGISFTEFSYMLVQAYDFAHLAAAQGCELQLGGSDQWGNITAGIELAARRDGRALHGLVLPLLLTTAGTKFGKSEGGNVWLHPAKTSPYAFHQFWLQTDDAALDQLLRFLTFIDVDDIAAILERHRRDPGQRAGQRALADDVTARVHGGAAVERATRAAGILFGGDDVRQADAATLAMVLGEVPTTELSRGALDGGMPLADALVTAGLASSKSDARRGIAGGGFSVNGAVAAEGCAVNTGDLLPGGVVLLRKGKKHWAALRIVSG